MLMESMPSLSASSMATVITRCLVSCGRRSGPVLPTAEIFTSPASPTMPGSHRPGPRLDVLTPYGLPLRHKYSPYFVRTTLVYQPCGLTWEETGMNGTTDSSNDAMQAIIQDGYGAPEHVLRLGETGVPSIGAGNVLIRVRATSVNTPDWATVAGVPSILRLGVGLRRPKRPVRGSDIAGVVEAVGEGVTGLARGDEVFGSTGTRAGAFAQYAVAPAAQLIKK